MKIKTWLYLGITVFIVSLIGINILNTRKINALQEELEISIANNKSLWQDNSSLKDEARVLNLTVEQLDYINDSIIMKLNSVRKELNIKDKEIAELSYQLSEAKRKDTVIFRDTLFRDPSLRIDTTITDKWYSLNVGLEYPSTIIVEPKFVSERSVIMSYRKETIKPPKKCWLGRLFQRKQRVLVTEIKEENPYIEVKQQKYIKVIK